MKYDERLVVPVLKMIHDEKGFITDQDIETAFWEACWDLELAIQKASKERKKANLLEEAKENFRKLFLPLVKRALEKKFSILNPDSDDL